MTIITPTIQDSRKSVFVLRAINANGRIAFYSGRSGQQFVEGQAFFYETQELASRKAALLNQMSALHGWHFKAERAPV